MAKARFPTETGAQTAARILLVTRENLFGNDTERDEQIRQKQHLFAHNHADIFAAFPSASTASAEMLQMVCDHITSHHHAPLPDIDHTQHPSKPRHALCQKICCYWHRAAKIIQTIHPGI